MRNNGITLIALVITIIVLIILAGVGISLTIGNNGIFKKAEQAKEEYINAKIDEEKSINMLEEQLNNDEFVGEQIKRTYLYKEGNEFETITNSWNNAKYTDINPSFSKETKYLYLNSTTSGSAGYFYTNNFIDFSKYTKVGIKWSKYKNTANAHFTMFLGDFNIYNGAPGTYIDSNNFCYTQRTYLSTDVGIETTETLEFDITTLTKSGSSYIYCYSGYLKIHEMWVE